MNGMRQPQAASWSGAREVVMAAAAPVAEIVDGAACYLRPGDAGFDECEACQ